MTYGKKLNTSYIYPILLVLISVTVCALNYKSGSIISGWDTLHPEFNFAEYYKRIFFSVWQQHQGLGAVATQAHASEIPRIFFLQFLSLFFNTNFIRWSYFFLTLIFGPLGTYFLTKYLFNKKGTEGFSFLAGLFYLLNLGTLQHFYVPLEMFATLYAFLPWLFIYIIKILKDFKSKDIVIFSFLTMFSSSMAHTSTLWFVYVIMLVAFLFFYQLLYYSHKLMTKWVRPAVVLAATFFINAFWLLPNLYFILFHSKDVTNAKITRLFTEEAILNGKEYATIQNIALLKNFLFNWAIHRGLGVFSKIFINWERHYENFLTQSIGYMFFAVILLSVAVIFYHVFVKNSSKSRQFALFLPLLIISIFFLLLDTPPTGIFYTLIVRFFPLLGEALRFPFTKFSIHLMLSYSLFFAFGAFVIANKLKKFFGFRFLNQALVLVFGLLIVWYMFPAFKGDLISATEKVSIPDYYKETFDEINKQEGARVATLPASQLFGWMYYDWKPDNFIDASYQGAGFTWFYSKNPILEREFDRWFPTNEGFYNEFQYAIYSKNPDLLLFVCNKYQVNYLLLDEALITPGTNKPAFINGTKDLLSKTSGITLQSTNGSLSIYNVNLGEESNEYVYTPSSYTETISDYSFSNVDPRFYSNSYDYVYKDDSKPNEGGAGGEFFPFAEDNLLASALENDELSIKRVNENTLYVEDMPVSKPLVGNIKFTANNELAVKYLYPEIVDEFGGTVYSYEYVDIYQDLYSDSNIVLLDNKLVDKNIGGEYLIGSNSSIVFFDPSTSKQYNFKNTFYSLEPFDCGGSMAGSFGKNVVDGNLQLLAKKKNVCVDFEDTINITSPKVFRIEMTYKSSTNSRPLICLANTNNNTCVNERYLNAPFVSENYSTYVEYVHVENLGDYYLNVLLEGANNGDSEITVSSILLSEYDVSGVLPIQPSEMAFKTGKKVDLESEKSYKVVLPKYQNLNYTYFPDTKYFNPSQKNCDAFNNGDIFRESFKYNLSTDLGNRILNGYRYYAQDSISCDNIKAVNLVGDASFLISFNYANITGKALDICIAGTNLDKCMLLDRLSQSSKVKTLNSEVKGIEVKSQSFILPSYPSVNEYTINIANQSIGRVPSENNLYSVETKYIPYEWLKGIRLINNEQLTINNYIEVDEVVHKYPHRYDLVLKTNIQQPTSNNEIATPADRVRNDPTSLKLRRASGEFGLVVLNQSFDKGWGIYEKSSCKFGLVSPLTCKKADAEHVLAKNWSNGWLFNNTEIPAFAGMTGGEEFVILFWPQWLQYFGYLALLLWGVVLAIMFWRSRA